MYRVTLALCWTARARDLPPETESTKAMPFEKRRDACNGIVVTEKLTKAIFSKDERSKLWGQYKGALNSDPEAKRQFQVANEGEEKNKRIHSLLYAWLGDRTLSAKYKTETHGTVHNKTKIHEHRFGKR